MMTNNSNYQGIKTFEAKLDYNSDQEAILVLRVDFNILTEENAHEINNFWDGGQDRLEESDGDIFMAVLGLAANHALFHLVKEDIYSGFIFNEEGWGGYEFCGIHLVSADVDYFEIDECVVTLMEDEQ